MVVPAAAATTVPAVCCRVVRDPAGVAVQRALAGGAVAQKTESVPALLPGSHPAERDRAAREAAAASEAQRLAQPRRSNQRPVRAGERPVPLPAGLQEIRQLLEGEKSHELSNKM